MAQIVPLPPSGTVVRDARGGDRALRLTWHHEAGVAVLSLWRAERCVGSVRVDEADVPELVAALAEGLEAPRRAGGSAG